MIIKVELRDKSFNKLEDLDNEVIDPTWEFNGIGGCGSFSFDLPRQYCNERYISGDFNVRIYGRNPSTNAYDLWFQGLIEDKAPNVRNNEETILVQGHGYQAQLSRIQLIDVTFTSTEISAIVKSLLDNYIVPNTDITYSASDIEVTGYTPDSLPFNTDVESAIETLADLAGGYVWGVDKDRKFFFKAKSTDTDDELCFPLGGKVTAFTDDYSFKDIVNRVIIQGGDIAGVPFRPDSTTSPYNSTASQLKYGRRDFVYQNSAIVTDAVAQQIAASILNEKADVLRRARCEIVNHETRIESTIPIPLFQLLARGTFYGEKTYNTFLYSGQIQYRVNRVVYKLSSSDAALMTNLELGQPRPDIAENIGQIKHQIEQLRSASL